ncbi:MAG: TonB-dependent receptor plug domain-containing protein, partial [Candidatus Nucleicultricaceae bacterium]
MHPFYLTSVRLIDAIFHPNTTTLSSYRFQIRSYVAVLSSILVCLPLSHAWCQPKATKKIVVRASRLKKEPQLCPNVEHVTSQNIERSQSYQAIDSLQQLPGIYVTSFGLSGGLTKVEMRGMPSYNTFVSLDGMPLNDPGVGGAANFSDESARDTETIQVVSGARALRYDPRAGSGAIIMTSKDGNGPRSFFSTQEGGNNKTGFLSLGSEAAQHDVQYYTVFSGLRSGSGSSINQVHGNLLSDYTRQFTGLASLKAKVNPHYNFRLSMRANETTLNMNDSADRSQGQPFPVRSDNVNTIARNLVALNNTIKIPNLPMANEFYLGHTQTRMITQFQGNDYVTDGSTQKVQYAAHFKPVSAIELTFVAAHERELALVPNKGHFSVHMNHLMGNLDIEVTKELTLNLGSRIIKHRLFGPKPSFWTAVDYKLTKNMVLFSSFGSGQRFPLIMDLYQTHPEKIGNP